MKTQILVICYLLGLQFFVLGQDLVPNAGFEDWSNNEPIYWETSNLPNGITKNIIPATPGRTGEYAIKGEVIVYPNTPGFPLIPLLQTNMDEGGFPITEKFATVELYYQFHAAHTEDIFSIFVGVVDANGTPFGGGFTEINTPTEGFTAVSVPMVYYDELEPARAFIALTINTTSEAGLPNIGSYFIVDDIALGEKTSPVEEPKPGVVKFSRAYPNPTGSELHVVFSISKNNLVYLDIFDLAGHKVAEGFTGNLHQGDHTITLNLDHLPSGLYLCRLMTSGDSFTQKIRVIH